MLLIYFAILASFLNMFLLLPVTPLFARSLTSEPALVALAVSAYSITNLVGNLFSGLLVDRFRKGIVASAGLGLGAAALFACGSARDIPTLVALLLINGAAISVVTPAAYALLGERLSAIGRAQGMARSGATIGLAALIGPAIGGRLADAVGFSGAYRFIGAGMAVAALILFLAFRGDKGVATKEAGLAELWRTATDRNLLVAFLGAFTIMFANNGGLVFALPAHVKAMGYSAGMVGMMFSVFALAAMAIFLSPLGKKAALQRPARTVALGGGVVALGLSSLALTGSLPSMVAALAVYGAGFGLLFVGSVMALVNNSRDSSRGTAFGVFYAVFSLGAVAGPMVLSQSAALGVSPFVLAGAVPALLAAGMLGPALARGTSHQEVSRTVGQGTEPVEHLERVDGRLEPRPPGT